MLHFLTHLFDTADFPPRWQCGAWSPGHGWLHVLSDLGVWSAYVAIPCVLGYFVLRKKDVPFRTIFLLFGAFILACGTTHLMEAIIFWWPAYRLAGLIKLFTALVSWGTVLALVPATPRALAMRGHDELEREIVARQEAERASQRANAELELRVQQRTAELARLEQELRQRVEELAEADRRKNEFLAILAHELRNPLAPIRNALHILKLPGADGVAVERVRDMMERQVRHMTRMVDDLLDVSRISRGKIELRKEVVDLGPVVSRTVEAIRPLIEERRHQLMVLLPPGPLRLEGDPTRLEQVLANLLHNAAKYTELGGKIELTVEAGANEVVVRVTDNGIGIRADMLARIFEPFVQAPRAQQHAPEGGLGIGLTLVRSLVEMHGGTVEAKSAGPGQGSELEVRLPALSPRQPNRDAPAVEDGPGPGGTTPRRVLVVDDNADAADSLAVMLRLEGHDVQVVHDGPAALGAVEAGPPDVVFLDIGMPGMNGYEVARRIRQRPGLERVVLVAMTGWGQEEDRRRSREAGLDHHLVKPAEPEALHRLLADLPR